jgi:hypothetical protein
MPILNYYSVYLTPILEIMHVIQTPEKSKIHERALLTLAHVDDKEKNKYMVVWGYFPELNLVYSFKS